MYLVYLKSRDEVEVNTQTGLQIEKALEMKKYDGYFKSKNGTFAISQVLSIKKIGTSRDKNDRDNELRILRNLLEVDAYNTRLSKMPPLERAEHEFKTRVTGGLNEEQKDKIATQQEEFMGKLEKFFQTSDMPVCPFEIWGTAIKKICGSKIPIFYNMVVRNDGAVERWKNRTGEWEGYDKDECLERIKYIESLLIK